MLFKKFCGALPEDVARLCYWNSLALCRQPLCAQIRVFTKAVRERDALDAAWLEGEREEAEAAFRLSIEAWSISRRWPRRREVAREPAENEHVSRDAASLLVPQEHGLRGDGPSPDTSNHKASSSPKAPVKVPGDAGEHVSRDAASLLVPQEHGLRGDGPPSTTFTTGANARGPTRVDEARKTLSVAIEAIGRKAFAFEDVTSVLETLAVTYRDEEASKLESCGFDEMQMLCAAQDGLPAALFGQDLEEQLIDLDQIKQACAEFHANDACLKDLLRGLTCKVESEKDSPSSGQVHVQCLTTLNECFKHTPSWLIRRWFKLVTTEDHSSKVESFVELCTGHLCSNLDRVCASDPKLAERVTGATKCLDILREWRVEFARSEHSPRVGAAEARL